MKKLIILALSFALLNGVNNFPVANAKNVATQNMKLSQLSDEELKNQDILDMHKNGLSVEIIITKIKTSKCTFDTSLKSLQELKAAGIPETIIVEMIEASAANDFQESKTTIKIPANTPISIESAHNITSATVKNGDTITFYVVSPVIIDGITVIEQGALVNGKIALAKKAGRWGRAGTFAWTFEEVFATDGKIIPLKNESSLKGEGNKGEVAIKTAATAALLAPTIIFTPLALLNGFKRGENAVLPAGSRFTTYIKEDANVVVIVKKTN